MIPTSSCPRLIHVFLAVAFIAAFASAQSSNPSSRIVHPIDETIRTTLTGTTPKAIKTAHDLGAIEDSRSLRRMMVVLTPSAEQRASLKRCTRPGPLRDFYVARVQKGMRPTMARLTLARKMAAISLTVWKKGVRFDPQQLQRPAA